MTFDPHLIVRAASVYLTALLAAVAVIWRRPSRQQMIGVLMACAWNTPIVLALQLLAARCGWWRFHADGGLLLGMPVEMYLSWIWLWAALPFLIFPNTPLVVVATVLLAVDFLLMPAASPVLELGPYWLVGETIGVIAGVLPGQLLARWTLDQRHLIGRALLQIISFSGLILVVLPAIAIEGSGGEWRVLSRPTWQLSLLVQLFAVPALLGLTAVQEFVERGRGTPVPFDPPHAIVTSGIYAYIRNPMQLSAIITLAMLGILWQNIWIAASGVMAHLYSVGLAGWDENQDLRLRFGDDWTKYRKSVPRWIPRYRPYAAPSLSAHLYVSSQCEMCTQVATWFSQRRARGLTILPAETHPTKSLPRITYESADGSYLVEGVVAIGRGLEHIHLAWAFVGFALRVPVWSSLVQLIVDASGGEPRFHHRGHRVLREF